MILETVCIWGSVKQANTPISVAFVKPINTEGESEAIQEMCGMNKNLDCRHPATLHVFAWSCAP